MIIVIITCDDSNLIINIITEHESVKPLDAESGPLCSKRRTSGMHDSLCSVQGWMMSIDRTISYSRRVDRATFLL